MPRSKINATVDGTVDLAPDMPGYQLRLRNLVIEPGGATGMHRHARRPGLSYVLEGTLTVTTQDGAIHEHHAGELVTESRDITHLAENRGPGRVVLISAHLVKKR